MHSRLKKIHKYLFVRFPKHVAFNILEKACFERCHCLKKYERCADCAQTIQQCKHCEVDGLLYENYHNYMDGPDRVIYRCYECTNYYCSTCAKKYFVQDILKCSTCNKRCAHCKSTDATLRHCEYYACYYCYMKYCHMSKIVGNFTRITEYCWKCKAAVPRTEVDYAHLILFQMDDSSD